MAKEDLECSFCGKKKPETNLLIAGLDAHICDRCIEQAHGIVLEESKQLSDSDLSAELILKRPQEIKSFLDEYIIGQETAKYSKYHINYKDITEINRLIYFKTDKRSYSD